MKNQTLTNKIFEMILFTCFCLGVFSGCANSYGPKVSNEIWDNSNAIYVDIDSEYVENVFDNWEKAFANIGLKAVFITDKLLEGAYNNFEPSLTLLLVLKQSGSEKQTAAVELLKNDERVRSARALNDVPFEPINTLAFPETLIHANVGDTITLPVTGYSSIYAPRFAHESIFPIILEDYNKDKTYTAADLPLSGASSIKVMNLSYADYLTLYLETPSYFNAIKAVHTVAQNSNVLAVSLNHAAYPAVVYSDDWFISDTSIAEMKNLNPNGWNSNGIITGNYNGYSVSGQRVAAEVLCKQAGTFTVTFTQSLGWRMGGMVTTTIIVE